MPIRRWFPYRVEKAQEAFFAEHLAEVDALVQAPPLSSIKKPQWEPRLLKPSPPGWAIDHLANLARHLEFLQPDARKQFLACMRPYRRDSDAIETQANVRGATHHLCLESGTL